MLKPFLMQIVNSLSLKKPKFSRDDYLVLALYAQDGAVYLSQSFY